MHFTSAHLEKSQENSKMCHDHTIDPCFSKRGLCLKLEDLSPPCLVKFYNAYIQ